MTFLEIVLILICLLLVFILVDKYRKFRSSAFVAERALNAFGKTTAYYCLKCSMLEGNLNKSLTATTGDLEEAYEIIKNEDPTVFSIVQKQYGVDLVNMINLVKEVQWQRITDEYGINERIKSNKNK